MNIIIILGWILLDQLTKYLVRSGIDGGTALPVLSDFVRITFVRNRGVAFSLFEESRLVTVVGSALLVAACIFFLVFLSRKRARLRKADAKLYAGRIRTLRIEEAALSFIIAGGISNLIDRFMLGYVTDMISIGSFAVFNVADIGVTCGGAVLIIVLLFFDREDEQQGTAE